MSVDAMSVAIWHDVECGGYAADLQLWEELAEGAGGPILELGCGTGRVALSLARRGHDVTGIELDPELVAAFEARATALPARALAADARSFELGREFALVLAPMQLVQLFAGAEERAACLARIGSHLRPGGTAALALVEGAIAGSAEEAIPDTREVDGWLYASQPLQTVVGIEQITIRRLRKTVSPGGELHREPDEISLRVLSPARLEDEAAATGLVPAGRREVAATEAHVGSTVVLLRSEA